MPAALEFRGHEGVHDFFRQFQVCVAGEAKHVHVIVAAHHFRRLFIKGLSRADAGDFVGGDVNAHAAGAAEQAEFRAPIGDGLRGGQDKIWKIIRRVL